MYSTDIPSKIPVPFGTDAASANIRSIPSTKTVSGQAAYDIGFPPECAQPIAAGGVPPAEKDFNGIFLAVTQWLRWQQAGVFAIYDSAFSSAIGGYPKGALVASTTQGQYWVSIVDSNGNNPDITPVGWQSLFTGVTDRVLGRYTLTASSGTFTPPAGTRALELDGCGDGGAGGGAAATSASQISGGGGGGSGARGSAYILLPNLNPISYNIGQGGTGVAGATGNSGQGTNFGSYITIGGGGGGQPTIGSTGNSFFGGQSGFPDVPSFSLPSGSVIGIKSQGQDGACFIGTNNGPVPGIGCAGPYGGGGGGNTSNGNGGIGGGYGAGGGGAGNISSQGNRPGGNGAPGVIFIKALS